MRVPSAGLIDCANGDDGFRRSVTISFLTDLDLVIASSGSRKIAHEGELIFRRFSQE